MGNAQVPGNAREAELARMMAAHGARLAGLCTALLKDAHLAQDVVQETFLRAYTRMDSFRGGHENSERAWLTRIAINTCRDMLRRGWFRWTDRRVTPEALPLAAPDEPHPLLAEAVMALPRPSREVVLLYYYQGMDVKETAQALGINVNTAKSRLLRARKLLKIHLEGGGTLDE